MKKYNLLIALSMIIYIVLAASSYLQLSNMQQKAAGEYKVEVNRLYTEMIREGDIDSIDVSECEYIDEVRYISTSSTPAAITDFFAEDNKRVQTIRPLYENAQLMGYVKFLYEQPQLPLSRIFWILEGSLLLLELVIFSILLYLRNQLIIPFERLSNLPQELAKGHYKGQVKTEKAKYLSNFLWGMGQLKDSLDYSRKRQLELEKEKKQLLLSLSHDIKTPLNLIKLYGKAIEEHVYAAEEDNLHAAHQIGEKTVEIEAYVDAIMKTSREDILNIQVEINEFYLSDLLDAVQADFMEACAIRKLDFIIGTYENRLIRGDLHRLREVLENLFDNAFKYGDGKRIELSFYEEDYCQLIRFYNTGKGIDENDLNHILKAFSEVPTVPANRAAG